MFGSSSTGFGNNNTFGSPSNTSFGFGTNNNNNNSSPFGGTSSGFGNNNNSSPFGGNRSGFGNNNTFGANNTFSGFGKSNTNSSSFGFNNNNNTNFTNNSSLPGNGTGNVNYQQTKSGVEEKLSYNYIAMTTMPQFQGTNTKTIEELRLLDYGITSGMNSLSNNFSSNTTSFFGSSNTNTFGGQNNNSNNLFGNNSSSSGFGNNNKSGGFFGNNTSSTNTGFGNSNSNAFGNSSSGFGSNNGSLFGNNNKSNNTGSLFGSNSKRGFGQSTNMFGTNNNNSGGLFGNNNNNSNSIFGGTNNNSGFGNSNSSGMFGNNNNSNNSGGLFGNNNNNSSGGLFGNNNNNNNSSGGLFGNNNTNNNNSSLFGNSNSNSGLFGNTNANNSGGLFSNSNNNSGGLFSNKNTSSSGLFGNNTKSGSNLFGNNKSSSSLFGNNNSNSLFGNSNSSSTSLFGGSNTNNNSNSNSLFNNNSSNNTGSLQNNQLSQLVNLASFAKNSNVEMKKQLELAKRAWNPVSGVNSSNYGTKKFKFQVSSSLQNSAESDPLEIARKFKNLAPKKVGKQEVQAMGALVVRSAQKQQKKIRKVRDSTLTRTMSLIMKPNMLKLTDTFKIDKTKRKNLLALTKKPIQIDNESEEKTAEIPQKLLFSVKVSGEAKQEANKNAPYLSEKLISQGYRTRPDIEEMKTMSDMELSKIENFAIIRIGYGSVMFPGFVDVKNLELSGDLIEITDDSVEVYKTDSQTPPVGEALNRRAEITIQNVAIPIGFSGGVTEFRKFLQNVYTPKIGAKFVSYDLEQTSNNSRTGTWKFEVEHFTKYAFDASAVIHSDEAEDNKVSIHKQNLSFVRTDKLRTHNFWGIASNGELALQSLSLLSKFENDFGGNPSLYEILKILQSHLKISTEHSGQIYLSMFLMLESLLLIPFELLAQGIKIEDITLDTLLKVITSEYVEPLGDWYKKNKDLLRDSSLDQFFEQYFCLKRLDKTFETFRGSKSIFVEVLRIIVYSQSLSVEIFEEFMPNLNIPDILLYNVLSWLGYLSLVPFEYSFKRDLGISIVSNFIASKNLHSEEVKYNSFLACLCLIGDLKFHPSAFEYFLKQCLITNPILYNSNDVMEQVEHVAREIDALSIYSWMLRETRQQVVFLKFNNEVELRNLLLKAFETNATAFEIIMSKALSAGVFDKRIVICQVIVNVLEGAYAKNFEFSKSSSIALIEIKELFLHIRNVADQIFNLAHNNGSGKIELFQKLYVLYTKLQNDIESYRKVKAVGFTLISHIENECNALLLKFEYIFQVFYSNLDKSNINIATKIEDLHFLKVKKIFS